MGYEQSQLRISTWPDLVPEVGVASLPVELRDGDLAYDRDQEVSYVELPNELVLRGLLELDIDDPDAVCAFLSDHGIVETLFVFPRPGFVHPIFDPLPDLAHVRAFLLTARALALHWIAHKEGSDVVEPWRTADLWDSANPYGGPRYEWSEEVDEEPANPDDAWIAFVTLLNEGMRAYQARAEYIPDEPLDDGPTIGGLYPDLYSGLCLQLLNIVTEDLPVLRCANATCERVFIRQAGRAQKGQHRTAGVMYCSRQCARAQANRHYRQRRRREQRIMAHVSKPKGRSPKRKGQR